MRRLIVSIHDVTPAHETLVRAAWTLCMRRGVIPALLVVPDWHGAWRLEAHEGFVRTVREWASRGADVLLHGERHDESMLPRGLRDAMRAFGRTAREGEFLTLDATASRARLARGLRRLRACGLAPIGFVPPAWLARPGTAGVVAALGLDVYEDATRIALVRRDRWLAAPAARWSTRTSARTVGSLVVARARRVLAARAPLLRLAIHPADLAHAHTTRSIERTLDGWLRSHRAVSYSELLADAAGATGLDRRVSA